MLKNKFDMAMDYIDANIHSKVDDIKNRLINEIGYNCNSFGQCFSILTGGETLGRYITMRKLYFALKELQEDENRQICDVAQDWGYSEQSAFSRAVKSYFGITPGEIRKQPKVIPDNKYHLEEFVDKEELKDSNSRVSRIFAILNSDGYISVSNVNFLVEIEEISKEYNFDMDTCYQIAELAERLDVPMYMLAETCFNIYTDVRIEEQRFDGELSPGLEYALCLGIKSESELEKICDYYGCDAFELDQLMVDWYYFDEYEKSEGIDC